VDNAVNIERLDVTTDVAVPNTREPRRYVPTLALANFGILLALLTPVLVSLTLKVQSLVGTEAAAGPLSLILSLGALCAMIANPIVGRLSDRTAGRWGMRRPWLIGGAVVGVLGLAVVALAHTVLLVAIGWCIAQIAWNAALASLNATLPDQVPAERRGVPSGIVGMSTPLGILVGSVLVNFFPGDFGRLVIPGIIALVLVTTFALLLTDRRLTRRPKRLGIKEILTAFVFNPRKNPDFGWVWLTKFLFMFGYVGVQSFMPLYLLQNFKVDPATVATTILVANLCLIGATVVTSFLGGFISDKLGRRKPLLLLSGLIAAAGLIVLAFAPDLGTVYVAQVIIGLGSGTFLAVDLALASQVLPSAADSAKDLGVLNIASALPQSLAPALAVPVMALGSAIGLGGYSAWYVFGAIVAVLSGVLVFRVKSVR